jgi:hypothetical protein
MLFLKCGTCGGRSFRRCGARASETIRFPRGGFYRWRKWNPCSEHAPGGLTPPDGRWLLDDLDSVNADVAACKETHGSIEVR